MEQAAVMVTGGSGFIGSQLVRRLTELHRTVVAIYRRKGMHGSEFTRIDGRATSWGRNGRAFGVGGRVCWFHTKWYREQNAFCS